MTARFSRLAEVAASAARGESDRLCAAALVVRDAEGPQVVRDVLRLLHLFFGFPTVVRALSTLQDLLPPDTLANESGTVATEGREPQESDWRRTGLELFTRLYGDDAYAVLSHLAQRDSTMQKWILGHAYGQVLSTSSLSLEEVERLAVLCLAATDCWKQWESHVRNTLRLGVESAQLLADLDAVEWITAGRKQRARSALEALS